MSYIGNPIVSTDFPVDYFSGNGSTTAFTLSVAPASVNSIDVQISGVSQSPQTYSVSGTTLTFSAAPPSGSSNIVVRHLGIAGIPNTPSAASVTQDKLASGVAGTGPAFSVYQGTAQSVTSGAYTKIAFDTENFDTSSCFNTSTYRFTPNVAGYYQINLVMYGIGTSAVYLQTAVYKNGSNISNTLAPVQQGANGSCMNSVLVYMNGSTDYIEGYGVVSASSGAQIGSTGAPYLTIISGYLARSA